MRRRPPARPSQLRIRNQLAFAAGETVMEQSVKRGRQPEGLVNDAIAEWTALHPEMVLGRNKRRLATPPGMRAPIMLGWLVEGSADWIGYRSITITPEMVGKRIALFLAIEAKRPNGGVLSKEQEQFLNALKDAGGCCGVATCAETAESILTRWRAG
jgi:hypothetical protein